MRRLVRTAIAGLLLVGVLPAVASAQGGGERPRRGTFEVSGGALWQAGFDLGDRTASLTRNGDAALGGFDLFTTSTEVDPVAGLQARVAYYLSRNLAIEGGVEYSRPVLSVRLTGDVEDAEELTAEESIGRYLFDAAVVYHLGGLAFAGGNGVPFVSAGGGHLRELHEGDDLVETGNAFHATGGLKYWFGANRRFGLRGEAGVSSRDGGADFRDGRRTVPVFRGSIAYLF